MSDPNVIADTTQTLTQLLKDQQQPKGSFEVTMASPADLDLASATQPQVNLYLFHIEPNPMGNGLPNQVISRTVRKNVDLALHLYYVMTCFADDKLDEHRILGQAMGIFYDRPMIENPELAGTLAYTDEPLKLDLCSYSLEDQTRIWGALGSTYRLGIFYRVRMVYIEPREELVTPRSQQDLKLMKPYDRSGTP